MTINVEYVIRRFFPNDDSQPESHRRLKRQFVERIGVDTYLANQRVLDAVQQLVTLELLYADKQRQTMLWSRSSDDDMELTDAINETLGVLINELSMVFAAGLRQTCLEFCE